MRRIEYKTLVWNMNGVNPQKKAYIMKHEPLFAFLIETRSDFKMSRYRSLVSIPENGKQKKINAVIIIK